MTGVMQAMVTNNIVTLPSPQIYIDANNSSSYPGTGTTITDLSGNGRTQLLVSASQYTVLSGVKCFDCNSSYIAGNTATPVLTTTGFTYIIWARMLSSTAGWRTLLRSSPDDHAILVEQGSNRLGMFDNNGSGFVYSGYDVGSLANTWAQWAVIGNTSGQRFFINGVQVGTSNLSVGGNSHLYTGGIAAQPFGYIANMYLYGTGLTQSQIYKNFLDTRGVFGV